MEVVIFRWENTIPRYPRPLRALFVLSEIAMELIVSDDGACYPCGFMIDSRHEQSPSQAGSAEGYLFLNNLDVENGSWEAPVVNILLCCDAKVWVRASRIAGLITHPTSTV